MNPEEEVRRFQPSDTPGVYALVSLNPEMFPRVTSRGLPPPHLFDDLFWNAVVDVRVVSHRSHLGERPAAVGVLYDVDYRNEVGWIEVGSEGAYGYRVTEIAMALARSAFREHGLRKIYWSVPGNVAQEGAASFMRLVGALPQHLLHEGLYWDLNFYEAQPSDVDPDR